LAFSQTIKIEIQETLKYSITFLNFTQNKNFITSELTIYNLGSIPLNITLKLEGECCKVIRNFKITPSEEKSIEIAYFSFKNESLEFSVIVNNTEILMKRFNITFNESLKRIEIPIDYIYEDKKLKILGNLNDFYFIILSNKTPTIQKKLNRGYNEIEIEKTDDFVDVILFNKTSYIEKRFLTSNPTLFRKIIFEIKKFLIYIKEMSII
ncbi:MAG: hypothetical protein QW409_03045, partial [Candidatus Aenigmatarchaeota archaeon]